MAPLVRPFAVPRVAALIVVALAGLLGSWWLVRVSAADPVRPKTPAKAAANQTPAPGSQAVGSLAIFERRIAPILKSPKPSSCSECHLSGVDLKDYIGATPGETFASLVAGGLVDVKKPDDSKLLKFIARKPAKPSLVTEAVRAEELDAFREWIRAAVKDPAMLSAKAKGDAADKDKLGAKLPAEVIRHARTDRVLASFVENIWSEVGRCAACHSPELNREQVKKHGAQVSWITPRDPKATMDYLVSAGLIDADDPEKSLLLRKPTMQEKHGGGIKMVVGDRSYKQFRRFLDDYAATAQGTYKVAADLPKSAAEIGRVCEVWLKLTDVPAEFDQKLLQVDLYQRVGNGWSKFRYATSDRQVFGKGKLWQHSLTLTAPRDVPWAKELEKGKLPEGRYLAKLYIDKEGKLNRDESSRLTDDDLVGQVEINSKWPPGYGQMTAARFPAK